MGNIPKIDIIMDFIIFDFRDLLQCAEVKSSLRLRFLDKPSKVPKLPISPHFRDFSRIGTNYYPSEGKRAQAKESRRTECAAFNEAETWSQQTYRTTKTKKTISPGFGADFHNFWTGLCLG